MEELRLDPVARWFRPLAELFQGGPAEIIPNCGRLVDVRAACPDGELPKNPRSERSDCHVASLPKQRFEAIGLINEI